VEGEEMNWYKDRDFPEVKRTVSGEPAEILAVIEDPKQLEKIVKVHNDEVETLWIRVKELEAEVKRLHDKYDLQLLVKRNEAMSKFVDVVRELLKCEDRHTYDYGLRKALRELDGEKADHSYKGTAGTKYTDNDPEVTCRSCSKTFRTDMFDRTCRLCGKEL
jgi:rubrerythrin